MYVLYPTVRLLTVFSYYLIFLLPKIKKLNVAQNARCISAFGIILLIPKSYTNKKKKYSYQIWFRCAQQQNTQTKSGSHRQK